MILLHGYTQTSRMWRPINPAARRENLRWAAPDLPGLSDSSIPTDGLDMKTAAIRIHALAKSLHIDKARVVGHDIGLMVAYAYAAQFPSETEKHVVMDAFLPGVAGWENVYNDPGIWHFRFNGPTPEALVRGRERIYFDYFWNDFAADKTHSLPEADRVAYVAAYSRAPWADACRAGPKLSSRSPAGGQGLRTTFENEADDAGPRNRRRKGQWNRAWGANENRGHQRHRDRPEKYGALGS